MIIYPQFIVETIESLPGKAIYLGHKAFVWQSEFEPRSNSQVGALSTFSRQLSWSLYLSGGGNADGDGIEEACTTRVSSSPSDLLTVTALGLSVLI